MQSCHVDLFPLLKCGPIDFLMGMIQNRNNNKSKTYTPLHSCPIGPYKKKMQFGNKTYDMRLDRGRSNLRTAPRCVAQRQQHFPTPCFRHLERLPPKSHRKTDRLQVSNFPHTQPSYESQAHRTFLALLLVNAVFEVFQHRQQRPIVLPMQFQRTKLL